MLTRDLRRGFTQRAILIRVYLRIVYGGDYFLLRRGLSALHSLRFNLLNLVFRYWLYRVHAIGERRDVAHFLYQPNTQTGL